MKVGDYVASTLYDMRGKVIAILGDHTGIVEVKGIHMYADFNYWVKIGE